MVKTSHKGTYKNPRKHNSIALAAMFLCFCSVLVIFQIPVYSFLYFDLSIIILLISTIFLEKKYCFFIGIVYPLFALLSYLPTDPIGMCILIVLNIIVLIFHYFIRPFSKKIWIKDSIVIITDTLLISIINIFLFTPVYYGWDYEIVFSSLDYWFSLYLGFNSLKLLVCYIGYEILCKILLKNNILIDN